MLTCERCGTLVDPTDPDNLGFIPEAKTPTDQATPMGVICPGCKKPVRVAYPSTFRSQK